MKRILCLLLAFFVVISLSACHTEEESEQSYIDSVVESEAKKDEEIKKPAQNKEDKKDISEQEEKEESKSEKEEQPEEVKPQKPVEDTVSSHIHFFYGTTCSQPGKCHCGATGTTSEHHFLDATCQKSKMCAVCGATEGEKAEHSWLDATCERSKMCMVCGITEGEKADHAWKEATCTTPKTCSTCEITEGGIAACTFADATCTTAKICKDCGKTEGKALGHEANKKNCSRCNVQHFAEVCELGKKYETPSGLEITLNSFTCGEYEGYTEYKINYTLANNVPDSKIGESVFMLYLTDGTRKSNYGWLDNLYYKDVVNREASFRLLDGEELLALEYYGLDTTNNIGEFGQYSVFDKSIVYDALHWLYFG